jgi:UDP-N-acetylmuramyl tripeptide synthase
VLHHDQRDHDLGAVGDMPLSFSGAARYNLGNLAGAALLASVLGVAPDVIAAVYARFGARREDNPGRLERWQVGGATVLLDYAHNPEGLGGLLAVATQLRQASGGRLGLLLGQAGNRDDGAIAQLAAVAASARPERVVLKDIDGYMRGREQGEVASILSDALLAHGVAPEGVSVLLSELEAAIALVEWARPDDVVVLPVHNLEVRSRLVDWLDRRLADPS